MTTVGTLRNDYRVFIIEDESDADISDGFHVNLESTANGQAVYAGGPALAAGSLLPGNLVIVDPTISGFDGTRPAVRRPGNTPNTKSLTNPPNAPTVADSGAAGTFSAAAYSIFFVLKNAQGQVTRRSAAASVTPTASHGVNVTVPNTAGDILNAQATSADVYATVGAGGATNTYGFLGNILAASFGSAQTFTAPPLGNSADPPADVNTTTSQINDLANGQLGVIFGYPYLRYMPTDGAFLNGVMVTVKRGRFTALLDANSFETSGAPTAVGDAIYPSSNSTAGDLGKFSKNAVGTIKSSSIQVGTVVGFAPMTGPGNPGVQVGGTVASSPLQATSVLIGGTTLVRVRFNFPALPQQ